MSKGEKFTLNHLKDKGIIEISPGIFKKVSNPQPRDIKFLDAPNLLDKASFEINECFLKNEPKELRFIWADKHISLNEWYSSKHWSNRNKIAKEWHEFFKSYLTYPYPKFDKYKVNLSYNSRLDPSNCITLIKLAEDMLQETGVIPNDTKEFCKGIEIVPDETMKKFSYKLTFYNINE